MDKFTSVPDLAEIYVKDMDLPKFLVKFPLLGELASKMRCRLPDGYKNYLVDLIVQECRLGSQTCRDVRWHVDGDCTKDNKYVLWVRGPNRTEFPSHPIQIADLPGDRNQQNEFLERMLGRIPSQSVPDMTFVSYDSRTPHRGVVCKESGTRTFVRMMATNYIRPKTIIKENLYVQLQQTA